MKLLVFGAGFSGRAILSELAAECESAIGTTRSEANRAGIEATGAKSLVYDGTITDELAEAMASATHLVQSIAPDHQAETGSGDPLLAAVKDGFSAAFPALQWIGYLSTVGVYGDYGGEWIDEDAECRPVSRRSKARLAAEDDWRLAAAGAGRPLAIIRLSGIYGPGRNAFVNLAAGKARRLIKPGQVFNRIHVADIAGATAMLARGQSPGIFNVTDEKPAPPQDVIEEAAHISGFSLPREADFETADLSPMARSFYGENKRVSNLRIREAGYRFRYPDYHAGLKALWSDADWKG
ncbi:MAG: NAD(P)-dependent oxidoreductase [Rhizobiales bacterium]|nr:NAD(P)-dependent oxidoreductase [Hyphomicrobiales bacterium]MBA68609.1 NAD(P)-dependent oxidoreductase [Hyphomicrobiales bacterium]